MKTLRAITLLVLLTTFSVSSYAQQDAQFSHYMFTQMYYNPAATGVDNNNVELGLIHRSQWLGYTSSFNDEAYGAPTTQAFTAALPIRSINSGVGLQLVNDTWGPFRNMEVQASYAYHLKLSNGALSFGVRGGLYTLGIYRDVVFRYNDNNDQLIDALQSNAGTTGLAPNFTGGVYYHNPKMFFGVGLNHISKSNFNFGALQANELTKHLNFMAGMKFEIDEAGKMMLQPSAIVKTDLNTFSFEASALLTYDESFYGGLSYRDGDAVIALLGAYLLDRKLRVGYGFDYVVGGKSAKAGTSHELSLTYLLPIKIPTVCPIVSPRFEHK